LRQPARSRAKKIEGLAPRALPDLPSLTFEPRNWDDISWTASGIVGLRTALDERIAAGDRLQAVVVRPAPVAGPAEASPPPPGAPETLLFMLWANEGAKGIWKLWVVEPVAAKLLPQG
jgi:hypothetical protein